MAASSDGETSARIDADEEKDGPQMRDGQIYKMQENEQQRFALLYRQVNFLNIRMEAYETVLKASTVTDRIKWLFKPAVMESVVNFKMLALLRQHDEEARERAAKAKEEAAKPKIVNPFTLKPVAVVLVCVGLLSGCVTMKAHQKALKVEQDSCLEARTQQQSYYEKLIRRYQAEIAAKNKRLKSFNQVDEVGNLRPLQKEEALPTQHEEWMK